MKQIIEVIPSSKRASGTCIKLQNGESNSNYIPTTRETKNTLAEKKELGKCKKGKGLLQTICNESSVFSPVGRISRYLSFVMVVFFYLILCPNTCVDAEVFGQDGWTCQVDCPDYDKQIGSYGGNVTVTVIQAINLPDRDSGLVAQNSDPYVRFKVYKEDDASSALVKTTRSSVFTNSLNPVWEEDVNLGIFNSKKMIYLDVYDADSGLEFADDHLGKASLRIPFCSSETAEKVPVLCDGKNEYTHCSASGSSFAYPIRKSCNETGWLVLDGTNDHTKCGEGIESIFPCIQIRIGIVPYEMHVVSYWSGTTQVPPEGHHYLTGTLDEVNGRYITVANDPDSRNNPNEDWSWARYYGRPFADDTQVISQTSGGGFFDYRPGPKGGLFLRTNKIDYYWVEDHEYASIAVNFLTELHICFNEEDKDDIPDWVLDDFIETSRGIYFELEVRYKYYCYMKNYEAVHKNKWNFLTSEPIRLYGGKRADSNRDLTTNYMVAANLVTEDYAYEAPVIFTVSFKRSEFWETFWEAGFMFFFFMWLSSGIWSKINFQMTQIETIIMNVAAEGTEKNVLASLFLSYNESPTNHIFRRNLYFVGFSIRLVLSLPLIILWTWGIIAIFEVEPPAVGYGLLFIGTSAYLGWYGYNLWSSQGWCMNKTAFYCLVLSTVLAIAFLIIIVFADPYVYFDNQPVNFLALSAVFGTLNLIPLIFRRFATDKSLARSMTKLLSIAGLASRKAEALEKIDEKKQKRGNINNIIKSKTPEKKKKDKKPGGKKNEKRTDSRSPFVILLGQCYSITPALSYFKHADMVSTILRRCTGAAAEMGNSLYASSLFILLLYGIIATTTTKFAPLAWSNICSILLLDVVHFLNVRGPQSWNPGYDVAVLSGGRLFIMVLCGNYWLAGYSCAYMLYGYALTEAVIDKYLPRIGGAEAGAIAFFGLDSHLNSSDDMSTSPTFAFSLLSFCFLFLLLVCAYVTPSGFPLPDVNVFGEQWPMYIFGVLSFLFILIASLARATTRSLYLYNEGLLMGSLRDIFFVSTKVRVPFILATLTQFLVICAGLLVYAATQSVLIFILAIFLPPLVVIYAYLYTQWAAQDYCLYVWPPTDECIPDDIPEDDVDVAEGAFGPLFSVSAGGKPAGGPSAFNVDSLGLANLTGGGGPRKGGKDRQFQLPPLVKTDKELAKNIDMPALPLKSKVSAKKKDTEMSLEDALKVAEGRVDDEMNNIPGMPSLPGETGNDEYTLLEEGRGEEDVIDGGGIVNLATDGKDKSGKSAPPLSRQPRFVIFLTQNAYMLRIFAAFKEVRYQIDKCLRKINVKRRKANKFLLDEETKEGSEEKPKTLADIPLWKAFFQGYLLDKEYILIFFWGFALFFTFLLGEIISASVQPYFMGRLATWLYFIAMFTILPIIKWFNCYEITLPYKVMAVLAFILVWSVMGTYFSVSLESNVNIVESLWVLNTCILYPAFVYMIFEFLKWRDEEWKVNILDRDGDGEITCLEVLVFSGLKPILWAALLVLVWELNIFGPSTLGILATLVFILSTIGFVFLRDWASNDFYLSPEYQFWGDRIVKFGMALSLFIAFCFDSNMIICLSLFFFLHIMRNFMIVIARLFVIEPDVPIFYSPYIFPVYSYSSRTNDLVDETGVALKLYSVLAMTILWGISFAIFVQPQAVGIAISCCALTGTVVITSILLQQVPLQLGSASRFIDNATIIEGAEISKSTFGIRRKPIEFECEEWDDADKSDPLYARRKDRNIAMEQRRTAAEVAESQEHALKSLYRIKNRRAVDKLHQQHLYRIQDALAEGILTGNGPFGILSCGGFWKKTFGFIDKKFKFCCPPNPLLKYYNTEDGTRLALEKLKNKHDIQGTLLELPDTQKELGYEFNEELRCIIHLWLLLMVASDARLRREKVLFQKFLRENRFKLLSNGIAPPKNIFSSASFASINISLVAVWLTTLTPEERERFHLLKSKFSEEQIVRDQAVDQANFEENESNKKISESRMSREEQMCKRHFTEIQSRRDNRLEGWFAAQLREDQKRFLKNRNEWLKNVKVKVAEEDMPLYISFKEDVLGIPSPPEKDESKMKKQKTYTELIKDKIFGEAPLIDESQYGVKHDEREGESLMAAQEAMAEIERAEKYCKPGRFGRNFQFQDPDFPMGDTSLGTNCGHEKTNIVWSVSVGMNTDAVLFEEGTDPDDVFGNEALNDGWLLSAISMLAAAGGVGDGDVDEQILNLFIGFTGEDGHTRYDTQVGVYGVRLYKNGQWETVIIDDFFPCLTGKDEDPDTRGAAYAYSKGFKELWVPLIEKAYAKYYGNYSALQKGCVHHALAELTGCESEQIFLSKASRGVGKRALWDQLHSAKKNGYILGAGCVTSDLADRSILDSGLVFGAAYTIYDVRLIDGYQLLKLRNPPGDHDEWKGDWSDSSKLWNKRLKAKLNYTDANDNTFWMSFDDFCMSFNSLYLCRWYNPNTWKYLSLYGNWQVSDPENPEIIDTSGGVPSKHNKGCELYNNPQWEVHFYRPTDIKITISQKDESGLSPPQIHPMALYLVSKKGKAPGTRISDINSENLVKSTGEPIRERSRSLYTRVDPGTYVIMAATYLPGMEGPFTITFVSSFKARVEQIWPPIWKGDSLSEKLLGAAQEKAKSVKNKVDDYEKKLDEEQLTAEDMAILEDAERQKELGDILKKK